MKKSDKPKPTKVAFLAELEFAPAADPEARKKWPMTFSALEPHWHGTVQTRQGGKLSIRMEGGGYLVMLELPAEGVMTTVVVSSLGSLMDEVEGHLAGGRANWTQTYAERKKNLSKLDK